MNDKFSGTIDKIFVKYVDRAKKNSISIINQGAFYGLGLYEGKTVEVDGKVLQEGWNVEFEYSGKFKNIDMNTFKIISNEVPKEIKNKIEKENMGMLRCHAFNGSTSLLISEGKPLDKDSILDAAKIIHSVTVEMKDWFGSTEIGKSMDQRELGNTVGNAVINCSNFSTRNSLSINVKSFLTETVPEMTNYISGKFEKQTLTPPDYDPQKLELHIGTQKVSGYAPDNKITTAEETNTLDFDDIPF